MKRISGLLAVPVAGFNGILHQNGIGTTVKSIRDRLLTPVRKIIRFLFRNTDNSLSLCAVILFSRVYEEIGYEVWNAGSGGFIRDFAVRLRGTG